jgi:hypothetical protein
MFCQRKRIDFRVSRPLRVGKIEGTVVPSRFEHTSFLQGRFSQPGCAFSLVPGWSRMLRKRPHSTAPIGLSPFPGWIYFGSRPEVFCRVWQQ